MLDSEVEEGVQIVESVSPEMSSEEDNNFLGNLRTEIPYDILKPISYCYLKNQTYVPPELIRHITIWTDGTGGGSS